jgi:uncharacterized membrane protein
MAEKISSTIIVRANISDVFNIWADFENFPEFMDNIKSVTMTADRKSHWIMEGPLGIDVEWDAITMEIIPDRRLVWQSVAGDIDTSGEVTFEDISDEETEISVTMTYAAPGGRAGETIARYIDNPQDKLAQDLRNFKQYVESVYSPLPRY